MHLLTPSPHFWMTSPSSEETKSTHLSAGFISFSSCVLTIASKAMSGVNRPTRTPNWFLMAKVISFLNCLSLVSSWANEIHFARIITIIYIYICHYVSCYSSSTHTVVVLPSQCNSVIPRPIPRFSMLHTASWKHGNGPGRKSVYTCTCACIHRK